MIFEEVLEQQTVLQFFFHDFFFVLQMKRSRFLVGAGCCFAGFVLADGLTVPRSSFHMAVIDRLVDERQHMLRFFDGFVSSLNLQRRIPNVIVEEMVEEIVDLADDNITVADRSACQFSGSHDAVPSKFAAGLDDYRGSGYTRGHLAAAGNFRNREQQVMCDTFILGSNIVPQEARNNEDFWFRMEVRRVNFFPPFFPFFSRFWRDVSSLVFLERCTFSVAQCFFRTKWRMIQTRDCRVFDEADPSNTSITRL